MLLAQPFLFYILDTLKKEYTLTYDVERITCNSDKMTFIAKRQIEVSSTSTEVLFNKICQINANLELFSMCMEVSI